MSIIDRGNAGSSLVFLLGHLVVTPGVLLSRPVLGKVIRHYYIHTSNTIISAM